MRSFASRLIIALSFLALSYSTARAKDNFDGPAELPRLSVPGRPQFNCTNPHKVMATIVDNAETDGPIIFRTGANHYRLIGLEITRVPNLRNPPVLVAVEADGIANHIVIDRSWLHGTVRDETQSGISLVGTNFVAVVDSYFNDFHCTQAVGACTDA